MRSSAMEELVPWQAARALAAEIHRATRQRLFDEDPTLRWQMRRAASDLMASIAGGYERRVSGDFARALSVSVGRAAELKSFIYLAQDVGLLERRQALGMLVRLAEVARLIDGWRRNLRRQERACLLAGRGWIN